MANAGHKGHLLVTQTYLSPQATIDPLTSRAASAAGRLGSNGVLGKAVLGRGFNLLRDEEPCADRAVADPEVCGDLS